MTFMLNTKLRQELLDGYESERSEWGDEYTDGCITKLQGIPDGEYPSPEDLGDVFDHAAAQLEDPLTATDLILPPGDFVALGVEYFGLED